MDRIVASLTPAESSLKNQIEIGFLEEKKKPFGIFFGAKEQSGQQWGASRPFQRNCGKRQVDMGRGMVVRPGSLALSFSSNISG